MNSTMAFRSQPLYRTIRVSDEVILTTTVVRDKKASLCPGIEGRVVEVLDGGRDVTVDFNRTPGARDLVTIRSTMLLPKRKCAKALTGSMAVTEAVVAVLRSNAAMFETACGSLTPVELDEMLERAENTIRAARLSLRADPTFLTSAQ